MRGDEGVDPRRQVYRNIPIDMAKRLLWMNDEAVQYLDFVGRTFEVSRVSLLEIEPLLTPEQRSLFSSLK